MWRLDPELLPFVEEGEGPETIDVDIFLRDEPVETSFTEDETVAQMKGLAAVAQREIVAMLTALQGVPITSRFAAALPSAQLLGQFWLTNSIAARVARPVLAELAQRDDVLVIQPARAAPIDELIDPVAMSDETFAEAETIPWNLEKIEAPAVWREGHRGEGALIAVIDTGINYRHPDLASRMWDGGKRYPHHGWDFSSSDGNPMDQQGHGTSCAGLVAGERTGVAPGAQILAIRVGGVERQFWAGLQFAIERGAHVISMSMTWKHAHRPNYPGWRRACEAILSAGICHANSIGNDGQHLDDSPIPFNIGTPGNCPPPAHHSSVPVRGGHASSLSCGATDSEDRLADFSSRGPSAWEIGPFKDYPFDDGAHPGLTKPDVCAPGRDTPTCHWRHGLDDGADPYTTFSGTSASTPQVAGAMALLVAASLRKHGHPPDPRNVQAALELTARKIEGQTGLKENDYGAGRIDVKGAFLYGKERGWW